MLNAQCVCQMMMLLETVLQQIRQLPNNKILKRKAIPETAVILVLVVMEQTLAPTKGHKNWREILLLKLRQICRFPLLPQMISKLF